MAIEIQEVTTLKDLKKFIQFPHQLYTNNPYWIPPLNFDEMNTLRWDRNPAFEYCETKYWLARQNGNIVGRMAGIINRRYIEKWKNPYVRFGWLDFIDDQTVTQALFNALETWAKQKTLTAVHGPLGFTDLDREGMLVEGFNELGTLATNYNHAYYPVHLEKMGYKKDTDWLEYEMKVPKEIPEKADRVAEIVRKKLNLRVLKPKKPKDILKYGKGIFDVLDSAYSNLYGVVPLTEKQVETYIKQYFGFVVPDFIKVVLDEKDQVVGFLIALPSLSRALQKAKGKLFPFGFIHLLMAMKKNRYLDLYLAAVRPDLQGKGVNSLFMAEITRSAIKHSIISAESNPELETNLKVQSHWDYYEGRQHKRRRCYIKHLK